MRSLRRGLVLVLLMLLQGTVFNAMDACKELGIDAAGLDAIWSKSKPLKLGGGFYVSKLQPNIPGKPESMFSTVSS